MRVLFICAAARQRDTEKEREKERERVVVRERGIQIKREGYGGRERECRESKQDLGRTESFYGGTGKRERESVFVCVSLAALTRSPLWRSVIVFC
jgi:hypothetical protein